MKKAIVIGSTGFLGSAVMRELIRRGYHVFATQNKRPVIPVPGLTVVEGGIRGLTAAKLDQAGAEAIFHCARPVMPRLRSMGRSIAAWQANLNNRNLVSQILSSRCRPRLIFASGSLVYGNSIIPHTEEAPLNPISYARQYHLGENPVLHAIRKMNTRVVMVRFPWILGDGSWFSWFYIRPLMEKQMAPLFGNGSNMMSLISLHDAARLMADCGEICGENGICNVISPHVMTQGSFAGLVADHFGGSVTDYRNLFPGGVEKAAYEAFTSNILLQSRHSELFENHTFQSPAQVLDKLYPKDE